MKLQILLTSPRIIKHKTLVAEIFTINEPRNTKTCPPRDRAPCKRTNLPNRAKISDLNPLVRGRVMLKMKWQGLYLYEALQIIFVHF
jgi:hypothetical protein